MDDCLAKCLQCENPQEYFVNPSFFHGICDPCAHCLEENEESVKCIRCESLVMLWFLKKNTNPCIVCQNAADVKHKACKHFTCSTCRVNGECPKCSCILCHAKVFRSDLCVTHKFCVICSSKFESCPWCSCQHCGAKKPEISPQCGHPTCEDCVGVECRLCRPICSFCKRSTGELKGNFCRAHCGCLDCYENFIRKDMNKCHYCANDYKKFRCSECLGYFFEVKADGEERFCEAHWKERRGSGQEEEKKTVQLEEKKKINGNSINEVPCFGGNSLCHYCKKKQHDKMKIPCDQGFCCRSCNKYSKIATCVACSQVPQGACASCNAEEYLFYECGHGVCVGCVENCRICEKVKKENVDKGENLLKQSVLCVCGELESCFLCAGREKGSECFVCGKTKVKTVHKGCGHEQCEYCLTNKNDENCSRCLKQYRCEDHNKQYFLIGAAFVLNKCCGKVVCKETRMPK